MAPSFLTALVLTIVVAFVAEMVTSESALAAPNNNNNNNNTTKTVLRSRARRSTKNEEPRKANGSVAEIKDLKPRSVGDLDNRFLPENVCTTTNSTHCIPVVTDMIPEYGPEAGGTQLVLQGAFPASYSRLEVRIGDRFGCQLSNKSYPGAVVCGTPPLDQPSFLGVPQMVQLVAVWESLGIRHVVQVPKHFTYKPNPILDTVTPQDTIVSGGLELTVTGQNLDAAFMPFMFVSRVYRGKTHVFIHKLISTGYRQCDVRSNSTMTCRTPQLRPLPAPYDPLRGGGVRTRRSLGRGNYLNDEELNFFLDFHFDGFSVLGNDSETGNMQLRVFQDPSLEEFKPDVKTFRTYAPFNEEKLRIPGSRLNQGCQLDDYVIHIGGARCNHLVLYTNEIRCKPPQVPPPLGRFPKENAHRVVVTVGNIRFVPGYLRYELSFLQNHDFVLGLSVTIACLALAIFLLLFGYYVNRRHPDVIDRILRRKPDLEHYYQALLHGTASSDEVLKILPDDLAAAIKKCLLDSDRLVVGKELGKGQFGKVFLGSLKRDNEPNLGVAVKTLQDVSGAVEKVTEFLQEAEIMKDFDHPNVLSLIGVVLEGGRQYVVLPLMANGDLLAHVRNPNNTFLVKDLLNFGLDVARGMAYLSARKFVHRDLAARNCMVNGKKRVVIADFGLSRDVNDKDYYRIGDVQRPLPIKWMALESLAGSIFTTKTDVWSYGVALWEILTRGLKPYADVHNLKMKHFLLQGMRLEKPDHCPPCVFDVMLTCWKADPDKRPTFSELEHELDGIVTTYSSPDGPPEDYDDIKKLSLEEPAEPDETGSAIRRIRSVPNDYVREPSRGSHYLTLLTASATGGAATQTNERDDVASVARRARHQYVNTEIKTFDRINEDETEQEDPNDGYLKPVSTTATPPGGEDSNEGESGRQRPKSSMDEMVGPPVERTKQGSLYNKVLPSSATGGASSTHTSRPDGGKGSKNEYVNTQGDFKKAEPCDKPNTISETEPISDGYLEPVTSTATPPSGVSALNEAVTLPLTGTSPESSGYIRLIPSPSKRNATEPENEAIGNSTVATPPSGTDTNQNHVGRIVSALNEAVTLPLTGTSPESSGYIRLIPSPSKRNASEPENEAIGTSNVAFANVDGSPSESTPSDGYLVPVTLTEAPPSDSYRHEEHGSPQTKPPEVTCDAPNKADDGDVPMVSEEQIRIEPGHQRDHDRRNSDCGGSGTPAMSSVTTLASQTGQVEIGLGMNTVVGVSVCGIPSKDDPEGYVSYL